MNATALAAPLPPFCTRGTDRLPQGPRSGTPESMALAAWEILTRARVSRSAGSGRMSLLGAYRAEGGELTRDRVVWISLHPFEGAEERWACRRATCPVMSDGELEAAIVQEMGGPSFDPDEMTTLGFWLGDVGFSFDSRGPTIEIIECGGHGQARMRRRRINRAAIITTARRLLAIPDRAAAIASAGVSPDQGAIQLMLL